jgi:hypothetical protein
VPSGDLGKRITWNRYLGVYSSGPQLDTSILPHGPYNTGLLLLRNSARSGSTAEKTFFIGQFSGVIVLLEWHQAGPATVATSTNRCYQW